MPHANPAAAIPKPSTMIGLSTTFQLFHFRLVCVAPTGRGLLVEVWEETRSGSGSAFGISAESGGGASSRLVATAAIWAVSEVSWICVKDSLADWKLSLLA